MVYQEAQKKELPKSGIRNAIILNLLFAEIYPDNKRYYGLIDYESYSKMEQITQS